MFTIREKEQFEAARKFLVGVLFEVVKEQARNSIFSQAHCTQLSKAYREAAIVAAKRRYAAMDKPKHREARNLSIAGKGDKIAVDRNL